MQHQRRVHVCAGQRGDPPWWALHLARLHGRPKVMICLLAMVAFGEDMEQSHMGAQCACIAPLSCLHV